MMQLVCRSRRVRGLALSPVSKPVYAVARRACRLRAFSTTGVATGATHVDFPSLAATSIQGSDTYVGAASAGVNPHGCPDAPAGAYGNSTRTGTVLLTVVPSPN
jgi:hypothetical protein